MRTEKNILIAFVLNLSFSVFEFIGGIFTGSVAITSDAVHDIGDAFSIGISYLLEKISKKQPDEKYTYGYARYSVFGSLITNLILLLGSGIVIFNAINRIIQPVGINYNSMIVFALVGVCVNSGAALLTCKGDSLNQKAVNLHMIEDVLGWIVVLVGAVVMRFTDFAVIDPIMSIGVAAFIFVNVIRNLKEITDLFLEKVPRGIDIGEIKEHVASLDDVLDVHHVHVWSMDGQSNYATMHIVTKFNSHQIKEKIRKELRRYHITHVTIEVEAEGELCHEVSCHVEFGAISCVHHHH